MKRDAFLFVGFWHWHSTIWKWKQQEIRYKNIVIWSRVKLEVPKGFAMLHFMCE